MAFLESHDYDYDYFLEKMKKQHDLISSS